jgi:hypothetical protein
VAAYPVGTPGKPWGGAEKAESLMKQSLDDFLAFLAK